MTKNNSHHWGHTKEIEKQLITMLGRSYGNMPKKVKNNILLSGAWGSGKSTFVDERILHPELPYVVLKFSPWEYTGVFPPHVAFLKFLSDKIDAFNDGADTFLETVSKEIKKALPELVEKSAVGALHLIPSDLFVVKGAIDLLEKSKLIQKIVELALGEARDDDKKADDKAAYPQKIRTAIEKTLNALLAAAVPVSLVPVCRILLVIEDLDRCRPQDAVAFLEIMVHIFSPVERKNDWPMTTLWLADLTAMEEFLAVSYRDVPSFKPYDYLVRYFDKRLVMPLPHVSNPDGQLYCTLHYQKWKSVLSAEVPDEDVKNLVARLKHYVLVNLRIYDELVESCRVLWDLQGNKPRDLLRDARVMLLCNVYHYFRDMVVLHDALWPEFVNRLNHEQHYVSDPTGHPVFRYIHDPCLLSLLEELNAIRYSGSGTENNCKWMSNVVGQQLLQEECKEMMRYGY